MLRRDPLAEIERIYRRDVARFIRLARVIVADEETAREVVQEAFTRAVDRRHSFRRRGPLEGWLWRIVVNEARKRAGTRRQAPAAAKGELIGNGHPATDPEIRAAVAALPERQRLAVFLRYYADLDYAAIAVALGIERGTVSATLAAAHRNLAGSLKEKVR